MGLLAKKVALEVELLGGITSRKEVRRIAGVKFRVKRDEMGELFQELRSSRKFRIGKRKVALL